MKEKCLDMVEKMVLSWFYVFPVLMSGELLWRAQPLQACAVMWWVLLIEYYMSITWVLHNYPVLLLFFLKAFSGWLADFCAWCKAAHAMYVIMKPSYPIV